MVIEAGVVAGYVIAWAVRKARRVAGRLDTEVDAVIGAGLDKLHETVAGKLGAHPALEDLAEEAATDVFGRAVTELVHPDRRAGRARLRPGSAGLPCTVPEPAQRC